MLQRALLLAAFTLLPALAWADAGTMQVDNAWVRAVPPVSQNSVAYFHLRNGGQKDDELLDVSTPAAGSAQMHDMTMNGDVMRMDRISKVRIKAGGELSFDPDDKHVMLLGLKAPLKAGQSVPLRLHFSRAGMVTVQAIVKNDTP